jgi:hypothetical protein
MKRFFLSLGGLLLAAPLLASTIMIFTQDHRLDSGERAGEDYIVYAIEDGLMEVLFDNGHILFNEYDDPGAGEGDFDRPALRLARSGGADFLLEVEIEYPPAASRPHRLPEIIKYSFSSLTAPGVIAQGVLYSRDYLDNPRQNQQEICVRLGRDVAGRILGFLSNETF